MPAPSRIRGTLKLRPRASEEQPATSEDERGQPPAGPAPEALPAGRKRPSPEGKARPPRTHGADAGKGKAGTPSADKSKDAGKGPGKYPGKAPERPRPAGGGKPGRSAGDRDRLPRVPAAVERGPRPERGARAAGPAPSRPVPAAPPLPPAAPPPDGVRLSKVMAERGICSRREADEFIERGWVFVDGKRVSELGVRIDPQARITLAPEATRTQQQRVTILLHKPVGYVSGQPEPGYAPAVSLIGADNQFDRDRAQRFHPSQLKNLAPAGRLDIDSTGLLVLTQDGRIARQLIGEHSEVDKEYLVRVEGDLAADGLALLNHGLELDGRRLRPAKVEWLNEDQLRFVLREGRKRQIRRMCELVGLTVVGLKRVRIGGVKLGDLPLGQWRFLRDDEQF
ncbi:pseudouridine synthase [Thauera aromatica]|nr:pseudouridine synthase [Thauera aromatica]